MITRYSQLKISRKQLPTPTSDLMSELGVQPIATQRDTNVHKKFFEVFVDNWIIEHNKHPVIVEIGAGKGLNVRNLEEKGLDIIAVEPFVNEKYWGERTPEYSFSSEVPSKIADIVYCAYVLNVVPEDIAKGIIRDIINILKPKGEAYIITRGNDISAIPVVHPKYGELKWGELELITKSQGKLTYQKGFTFNSLRDLILSVDSSVTVEKAKGSAAGSVKVILKK
jgi:SAM-dependent methyltransferase